MTNGTLRPEVLERWDDDLSSRNPLGFEGYSAPGSQDESVRTALMDLGGTKVVSVDCRFDRFGGTLGVVSGERIVRAADRATELGAPLALTLSSGGVRLQEGVPALVQMARTVSAMTRHGNSGLRSAAYLHSPTTGGVFASIANVADLRAAAPGGTIGFGGPRVVAQVTGRFPPSTSHTSESARRHGLVDAVVDPARAWAWLAGALGIAPAPPLTLPTGRPSTPDTSPRAADAYSHLLRTRGPGAPRASSGRRR